jgi:hypothetical protein
MSESKILFEIVSLILLALSAYSSFKMLGGIRKRNWLQAYEGAYPVFVLTLFLSFFSFCVSSNRLGSSFKTMSEIAIVFSLLVILVQRLVNLVPTWGDESKEKNHYIYFKVSAWCGLVAQGLIIYCLYVYLSKVMVVVAILIYLLVSLVSYLAKSSQNQNN